MNISHFVSAEISLAENERIKIKGGRKLYGFAGSCWRPKSHFSCFVSDSLTSNNQRYLPDDTEIEIVRLSSNAQSELDRLRTLNAELLAALQTVEVCLRRSDLGQAWTNYPKKPEITLSSLVCAAIAKATQ